MPFELDAAAVGRAADEHIALLQAELVDANTRIADLSGTNAGLLAANQQYELDLRACRARVRRLLAQIEELKNPVVTVWGSSTGRHSYDYFTQMAGAPLAARRSYEGAPRASIVGSSVAQDIGRCVSVNSMAFNPNSIDVNAAKVESYLRSFPTDHELDFIVSHEPENPDKKYVAAEFVAQQQEVRRIVDRVNADRVVPIRFGGNFMAWSANPKSGRDMGPWFPGEGVWDFLAWDGYSSSTTEVYTPEATFAGAVQFCADRDVPFAIAECGVDVAIAPELRVQWIDACQQWAKDQGAVFWMYWDGSFSTFWLNTPEEFKAVVEGPS